jgi:predicted transposase YdaD
VLYDIASKRLAQIAPAPFLSLLLQRPIDPAARLEELPQEMPTLNRADRVWRVETPGAEPYIALCEFLTYWDAEKKLDMALYSLWLKKRYRLRVVTSILLCLPNEKANDEYADEDCRYKFLLVKTSEMDAQEVMSSGELGLFPLLPLMRGGVAIAEQAGRLLYESQLQRTVKADLLALLDLFLGLTDKDKAVNLIWKRTEFMNVLAESPIYQMIQEEGRRKGWQEGQQEGQQEGWRKGLVQAVKLGLELRFGGAGTALFSRVEQCTDVSVLTQANEALRTERPLEEIEALFL